MQTQRFTRKAFDIEAVQVTAENVEEVAAWCGGVIQYDDVDHGKFFIKVDVHHPLNVRQTTAFVGDWILSAKKGFKVYTPGAFASNFVASNPTDEQVSQEAVEQLKNVFDTMHNSYAVNPVNPADQISGKRG